MVRIVTLCGVVFTAGCATAPYQYGKDSEYVHGYRLPAQEPQIVCGRPNKVLDASGWIWPGSLIAKLVLWNYKVDSHVVSTQTVEAIRKYLAANELKDVKVRINAYSVGDEWRRTFRNTGVGAGWRYTFGFFSWLGYTVMPQRFFGGDNYSPYSNTINIYSDIVPVGLHESGHARDFAKKTYKGTYAFVFNLPILNLHREAIATTDALSYLRDQNDSEQLQAAYKILYPAYGTYVGSNIGDWLLTPWNYVAEVGVVIPGHILGRVKAAGVPDQPAAP